MKTLIFIVDKGTPELFESWTIDIPFIYASGKSLDQLKENVLQAIELYKNENQELPDILKSDFQIAYKMDVATFLAAYKGILSFSALQRITKINQKQLQHYASGLKTPSLKTAKKIESGIHNLAKELIKTELKD